MNEWRQISPDYWMCFYWDVCRSGSGWQASTYLGTSLPGPNWFASADAAMKAVNLESQRNY